MDWLIFIVLLAACCTAGATGSLFPPGDWYFNQIRKPAWTPPRLLFPIAWTTLYILSALAATWVAMVDGSGLALALWALQIALNTLWTPVFFGLHQLRAGMIVLASLWCAVLATMIMFWTIVAISGWFMLPYLVWVSYAGALNFWIWQNNKTCPTGTQAP